MNRIVINIHLVSELRSTISFVVSEEYKYLKLCETSKGQFDGSTSQYLAYAIPNGALISFELDRKLKDH